MSADSKFVPPKQQTVPFPDPELEAALDEIQREEVQRLEAEEMEKHFRKHPHG